MSPTSEPSDPADLSTPADLNDPVAASGPVDPAPVDASGPADPAAGESASAETAPAETAPAETAPAETAPAESALTEPAPDESASAESAPAESAPADGATSAAPAVPIKPRRLGLVLLLAGIILVLDQITKIIAVATIPDGESPSILGGLVYFSLIRNPGAAWSIGTGLTWVLAIVACVIVVVIIRMATKLRSTLWATCLGLILGGALGNLMDRFFRSPGFMRGHVVDFVSVFGPNAEYFPVFNVADSGITIGGILLVVTALLGVEFDGTRVGRKDRQKQSGTAGVVDAAGPDVKSGNGSTDADRRG